MTAASFKFCLSKILFLVCPLCHGFLKISPIIKYRTSDTCLPIPFFPSNKDFEFTSGACWQWRKLVSSLSDSSESPVFTEAGDKVCHWAAWKGSETCIFRSF